MTGLKSWHRPLMSLVLLLGLLTTAPAQQPSLAVDGISDGTVIIGTGELAVITATGLANQPFALLVGTDDAVIYTPAGVLGINPLDPWTFLLMDGFDAVHPLHSLSFLGITGVFNGFAVPFDGQGAGIGFEMRLQALIADPTAVNNYIFTTVPVMQHGLLPPQVHSVTPSLVTPGTVVRILGSGFDPDPAGNTVELDGDPCTIVQAYPNEIQVLLPNNARSGTLTVTNAAGNSGSNPDALASWVAVADTADFEAFNPVAYNGRLAVFGQLHGTGEIDTYTVNAQSGEEIFAELYSWDDVTQEITGPINTSNPYFDARVRILVGGTVAVALDDDSGPSQNAGIGLSAGQNFFVADTTGAYTVEVSTYLGAGWGHYVLIMGARTPGTLPAQIQSLTPNVSPVNGIVTLYGTGIDHLNPSANYVTMAGVTIPAVAVAPGRLDFQLPVGLRSGPVQLHTPNGSSNHPLDRMESWLTVLASNVNIATEGQVPTIQPGDSWFGTIGTFGDKDDFLFNAVQGTSYRIEVYAYADNQDRVLSSTFLASSPLDPEVRVFSAGVGGGLLVTDNNSGPGVNALLGLPGVSAPFIAGVTTTHRIEVTSWFGISNGRYLLTLLQD